MQGNDPIEVRILHGGDAAFTLYEDEGDNYDYEKGVYAGISRERNEAEQTLKTGERHVEYAGMLNERAFHIV